MNKILLKAVSCFLVIGMNVSVFSQNKKEDSLLAILKTQKDTACISTYLKLAALHYKDTNKVADKYLNKAYALAKPSGEKRFLGDYYVALGIYKEKQGDPNAAVDNYNNGLTMYKAAKYYPGQINALYRNGVCHARSGKIRLAIPLFEEAAKKATESNNIKELANSNYNIGYAYASLGENKESIKYYTISLEKYKEVNDSDGMAKIYNVLGSAYQGMSDFSNSISAYISAKKIYEKLGQKKNYAGCLVNMGFVYEAMHNEDKALEGFYEAEKILESIDNKDYLANVRHSIGTALLGRGKYEEALKKYQQAKETFLELENQDYYANCLFSIAEIYSYQNKKDKALALTIEGLQIKRDIEEQEGICTGLLQLGQFYSETGKIKQAIGSYDEALGIAKKIGAISSEINTLKRLADLNSELGNYKVANAFYAQHSALKDSVFKTESAEKIAEMEALYKTEKQAGEISMLNEQKKAQESQLKVNGMQRNMLMGGIVVLFIFAFLISNRYRLKQRSNLELQSAYNEIQVNRDEIALQKKEIMDSIYYAKRIQEAILPTPGLLNKFFTEYFVFYRPKDVVSGDLYWFSQVKNTIMLAAVDCTGHGVPGAFMSVIGVDHLNHLVNDKQITDPAKVLTEMDHGIFSSFAKDDSGKEIQDGMDIALCSIDLDTKLLNFSGAHRPLIHVRDNVVTELKPTKASIGGYLSDKKTFSNNILQLQKGDCIYMFTDGYADQFGGPRGKKFKYKQLIDLILNNVNDSMEIQKQKLSSTFENWKAWPVTGVAQRDLEQVDDVCVIGVRV